MTHPVTPSLLTVSNSLMFGNLVINVTTATHLDYYTRSHKAFAPSITLWLFLCLSLNVTKNNLTAVIITNIQ